MLQDGTLALLIFIAAALYSSVGHAGASGYLAAMALCGVAPPVMKPAALALNILVAGIGTYRFWRAGHVSWRLLLPFVAGSVPLAFFGGASKVPAQLYKQLLGGVLLIAAVQMVIRSLPRKAGSPLVSPRPPHPAIALLCGVIIGYISGLTGTGGGIFLSPLILTMNWADPKKTAGASVVFILLNSIAGLAGQVGAVTSLPMQQVAWWAVAAVSGGLIGSHLGAKRLDGVTLRRVLAVVLVIAGAKLIFTPAPPVKPAAQTNSARPSNGRALQNDATQPQTRSDQNSN